MTPASIQRQVLLDGPRNFAVRLTAVQDGSGTQLTNVKVVDVATMTPPAGPHFKLRKCVFSVLGGIVQLAWESGDPVNPVPFAEFQLADHRDYRHFGGESTLNVPNATGNILLSTFGFDLGSSFDIVLEAIKGIGTPTG